MEISEAERVVVAKPVAARPASSHLLPAASTPNLYSASEATFAAIRPKTVRLMPMPMPNSNSAPPASTSFLLQADLCGSQLCTSYDDILKSDCQPTVIYKPQAKLVSPTTVSLLENMGNFTHIYQQQTVPLLETPVQNSNFSSQFYQNIPSQAQTDEPSRLSSQALEDDPRTLSAASNGDRPSYDGYNWRKYGQKHVKGSEHPRSYYKCTYPNCPVKKKVERSLDGQIAEIVYKGEHNHSKPRPLKRNSSGPQELGYASAGSNEDKSNPLWNNASTRDEASEGRAQNQNENGLSAYAPYQIKALEAHDTARAGSISTGAASFGNLRGLSGEFDEGGEDEPRSKRRRSDNQSNEAGISREGAQEPSLLVQGSTDTEISGDGFRWRKYGQKVVRGNLYPRSYYRCTGAKCTVRKYVERVSDDPGAYITTYEGKHNHEKPLMSRSSNSAALEFNIQAPSGRSKTR